MSTTNKGLGLSSPVADGAATVAHYLDTASALATTGALLMSWRNAGAEKIAFGYAGELFAPDGTVLLPGISFLSDRDSGFYRIGANNVGLTLNGAKVVDFATVGVTITGTLTSSSTLTVSAGGLTVTAGTTAVQALTATTGVFSSTLRAVRVGIGAAAAAEASLEIATGAGVTTGTDQRALVLESTFDSTATVAGRGLRVVLSTQAAAFTMTDMLLIDIVDASKGAGSAITTQYGLKISSLIAGATNWSIHCASGNVTFRTSALGTADTTGHLFIPASAGAPTGVPASIPTGQIAFQYDSSNNKLYAYNGAWRSTAALA